MSDFIKIYEHRKKREHRAFNALEVAMEWVQRQDSVDPIQLLRLKRLRNMAAEKRMSSLMQKTKEFLVPIRMFSFNVYRAMYVPFDNFHAYFYIYIIVQILLKKNTFKSAICNLC